MRILWVPHTGWHITQRAHLFCHALAANHELHVTDWVADFATLRDYMSWRYLRNFTYRKYKDDKITVHGIPRFSPAIFSAHIRNLNQAIFSWYVQRLIKTYHIEVCVGTYLIPPPQGVPVIFDLFDENVSLWRDNGYRQIADEIEATEAAYFANADTIVAASSVLVDKAHTCNPSASIVHIPNGIDLALFKAQLQQTTKNPIPVIGSVANFADNREIDLILDAAKLLADATLKFRLAGRGKALDYARRRVTDENLYHVQIEGAVKQSDLAKVLNNFDVALCIYNQNSMDDARSPMRVIASSALGIPTVVTATEEIRRMSFPNLVLTHASSASIATAIQHALTLPRQVPATITHYDIAQLAPQYEAVLAAHLK